MQMDKLENMYVILTAEDGMSNIIQIVIMYTVKYRCWQDNG